MQSTCHEQPSHCEHAAARPKPSRRLLVTLTVFAMALLVSFAPPLHALNTSLLQYLGIVWWAVLLGLLVGGVIDYFVPSQFVVKILGRRGHMTLLRAALAGVLMSACSHGILAIAIQLYKKGASVPAVITFLLASPWANLPITVLLFGFFGWQAVFIVVGAIVIAITSGLVFTLLDRRGLIETSTPIVAVGDLEWRRFRDIRPLDASIGVLRGALSLANMVLWWILVGILVAAIVGAYVPEHWFMKFLGPDISGMLVTLLFATVIEVCSEGSSPIAFEIYNQLGVLGNPFVFLMAGVATDYTEIGLLWTSIGKRTAIWLPIVTVPQILLYAWLLNNLLG